jgi:hypothetical protein
MAIRMLVLVRRLLCATSVSPWCEFAPNSSTTETQRTQRLHREVSEPGLLVQSESLLTARWRARVAKYRTLNRHTHRKTAEFSRHIRC